jgi:hypothetical protein
MVNGVMTNLELQVLIELLEAERSRLPHEIHHTDARAFKHELCIREQTVERLAERFRQLLADHQTQPANSVT